LKPFIVLALGVVNDTSISQKSEELSEFIILIFPVNVFFLSGGATTDTATVTELPAAKPVPLDGVNVHVPHVGYVSIF